jgi:N-acetylmuramoyl-L-alanine amidase
MKRSLAWASALLLAGTPLLNAAEPLYGLMVYPRSMDWVPEVSQVPHAPKLHTHREPAITLEEPATRPERLQAGRRTRSSDDLLAALTNARDLGPVLAGFDPPAPLEERPRRHLRRARIDPHEYVAVDARHGFHQGGHNGTRVTPGGRLELAEGRKAGVFVSKAFHAGRPFDHAMPGLAGDRGARVFVRAYRRPGGPPSRWRPVRREKAFKMQAVATVLQVAVLLLATAGNQNPGISRVTFDIARIFGIPMGGGPGGFSRGPSGFPPYSQAPRYPPYSPRPGTSFPPRSPSWYPGSNRGRQPAPPYSQAPRLPPMSGGLRIVSRAEWGARPIRNNPGRLIPQSITIHHTEGAYTGPQSIKDAQDYHLDTKGWSDIGYHFLIGSDGVIYEGREFGYLGAHSPPPQGRVGVCFVGNFMRERPSQAALGSAQRLIQALIQRAGVRPGQIYGHRDQRSTDCPGTNLYPYLGQFRAIR